MNKKIQSLADAINNRDLRRAGVIAGQLVTLLESQQREVTLDTSILSNLFESIHDLGDPT